MFEEYEGITVEPQDATVGTLVRFSADGFTPHTSLKALITDPSGNIIYEKDDKTDEQGRITFKQRPTAEWALGTYTFKVTGNTTNGKKTLESKFRCL